MADNDFVVGKFIDGADSTVNTMGIVTMSVPVVDETGKLYRGNIYRMHLYKHKSEGGDMSLPVTHLLKNATKYVHTYSSFYNIFFMIKDLPYITVLDENNHFYGILTHSALISLLEQSWNLKTGSYVLTIAVSGDKGDLANVSKIINRYSSIMSTMTLDSEQDSIRRLIMTLEPEATASDVEKISEQLDRRGYRVIQVEDLKNH